MNNGGPGQFRRFLARKKSNNYWKVDRLFRENYTMVADDLKKV